jgi:CheY-like chemotaxis protein
MIRQEQITPGNTFDQAHRASNASQSTVLLAEDDKALRRFLEVSLERAGYNVILAADGLEAMKAVLCETVDVVVTDAIMPNLNGHELCRFIRNTPQISHLPVVLLSALEGKESNEGGQADAFLTKPVSPETLSECLEELLLVAK